MIWVFRPDAETVWYDDEVKRRLSWYRSVMVGEKPAKFLICKNILVEDFNGLSEQELWLLHDKAREMFVKLYEEVVEGSEKINFREEVSPNFLDLKIELVEKMIEHCIFCEHRCSVNRKAGFKGFCKVGYTSKVSTWFHHFGEEGPLLGRGGSGTIFFAGCNFGPCVYCQNWDISSNPENGVEVSPKTLSLICEELKDGGAANINYVGGEPTPNLHTILKSMKFLKQNIPQLWNSNMYCSIESMKLLSDVIDIWLPDFKYGNDSCAKSLSKVDNYFEIVSRNHLIASKNGDMIIRHLVLPGHIECCTKPILKWISENIPNALVNIMRQYHPDYLVEKFPQKYKSIYRRVSSEEMSEAYSYAKKLGIVYEPVS